MNTRMAAFLTFIVALGVRLKPFLLFVDWRLVPFDYDEGVYFSAAHLITKGFMPYRDFFFVHPPGIILSYAPIAALSTFFGLAKVVLAAKIFSCFLGAANAALVVLVLRKWVPPYGALLGGLAYAGHYGAFLVERGIFLESVANFWVLLSLILYPDPPKARGRGYFVLMGVSLCCAVLTKVTAVLLVLPIVVCCSHTSYSRIYPLILGVLIPLCIGVILGTIFGVSPSAFLEQVLFTHFLRPTDGDTERLALIFHDRLWVHYFLAVGSVFFIRSQRPHVGHFALALYAMLLLSVVLLLVSKTFWSQYLAILAIPHALLAGLFVAHSWAYTPRMARLTAIIAAGLIFLPIRSHFLSWKREDPVPIFHARQIAEFHQIGRCFFTFEPGWQLLAGYSLATGPCPLPATAVDPYGSMLILAYRNHVHTSTIGDLYRDPMVQKEFLAHLQGIQEIFLGSRGRDQLTPTSIAMLKTQGVAIY